MKTPSGRSPWVKQHGVKYAYGYDKGGKLAQQVGVRGIPNAILLDPTGKIVWQGHPGGLRDEMIRDALQGALPTPVFEWPDELSAVKKSLMKGKFKDAIVKAERIEAAKSEGILDAINAMVQGRIDFIKSCHEKGDYLTADEMMDGLADSIKGLETQEEELDAVREAIKADPQSKEILKAQRVVRKLITKPLKSKNDAAKMLKQMMQLERKYNGNIAGKEAKAYAAKLRSTMG